MVNSLLKLTSTVLILLLVTLACGQIAPQFDMVNKTLGATTSYKLSYYSSNAFNSATTITVAFNQSYVKVPQGSINCAIKVNTVLAPLPYCMCSSKTCTFKPMVTSNNGYIQIQMFNLVNPFFIYNQTIPVNIYFSNSANLTFSSVISAINYQPMSVTINKITQSDYGVGYTPVSYTFNLSLPYISKNMQMQLSIPGQVTYSSIPSTLSFYNTVQNGASQFSNLLIYNLQINQIVNPAGSMQLIISNLGNPTFLGNSSSFKLTFLQINNVSNCQTCKIAQITSGMLIQSRNPGDIETVSITANNNYNAQTTNLTITLKFYAGIPLGGKISIYLPQQITPTLPIVCAQVYGFIITNNSFNTTDPVCTYNDTYRRIDTVNFNTPIFSSTGDAIITIQIVNPQDSRRVNLKFETYDNYTRMIGQSRSNSYYNSVPVPLKAIVSKTSQEIDKSFNMFCNLTLTQSLNLSSNFIQVILPPVGYNLSAIICTSAGQDLNCSKTIDLQQNLVLTFAPPCSQCSANNSLQFTVMNLKNPPFISDLNQMIIVNTRSTFGIIQSSTKTISLVPTSINLFNYYKPSSKPIGFQYNLSLNLSIPDYVKINGGQIHILFSPKSTYYDGQLSGFNYNGPSTTLEIVSSNNTSIISNSVQYDPDSSPDTISKIIFNICDGAISVCALTDTNFTFIIKRLKLGYIPSQQTSDTLRISTKFGQIIAQKLLDTSSYAPTLYTAPLNIYVSRSITNSLSDFQFSFSSSEVVFDKLLIFTLPTSLIINGLCTLSSNQGFVSSFVCTKTSNNSISISSNYDQNLMISQNISYTILITNVTTPISMVPLTYTLQTTYNGTRNQRFSVRYAMQTACPLSVTYSKTNYTINQEFRLSITINPVTLLYDSYQINLAKNTVITQLDWVSPPYTFVQNQTHYILSRTGVMTNNYTQIRLKNSLSTYQPPQYTVNLLQAGYLAQQYIISPPNNLPVMLGCNVSLTNRTVNFLANMTITCDRNSNGQLNDQNLVIKLPINSFDYTGALFNGAPISTVNPVISVSITATSPRIISLTITSLKNLLYIPNLQSPSQPTNSIPNIEITTIQENSTKIVGSTSIQAKNYIPNDAYDIKNASAVRTSTKSGQFTNITLQYVTYLGTDQHAMVITLPSGQNGFNNSSGCYTGADLDACNIIEYNSTDMKIVLVPNATVTLTKSINYYPNTNLLKIRIFKFPEMQLVEQSYTQISPAIALEKITVLGKSSSSKVSDISIISLQLKPSTLKIQSSNTLQISVPPKMYTRAFNTDDCVIKPSASNNTYTGCTYDYDANEWLRMIRVGSFGPLDIDINASLFINFTVTNAWTTYSFANQSFSVTVYKTQSTASSQGTASLTDMYPNLPAFTLLPISQPQTKFSQLLLTSGSSNNLTINMTANGNIGKGTKLMCMIPKDAFIYTTATGITFERQDVSYFYVSLPTNCVNAGCLAYSQQFVIPVQNNYYIKKQRNNIIFYLQYDGLPNSQSYAITPDYHLPLTLPALTLTRSSSIGGQITTVSIKFNLTLALSSSVSWFGPITIDVSKNITSFKYLSTAITFNQQQDTQFTQQSVSISQNEQNITVGVPVNVSNSSVISQVKISGKNTIQAPIGQETYWIVVQNTTHILYTSYNIIFATKLVPMSQGLTIVRSDTTVGVTTDLRVQGSLPSDQFINITQYPLTVNSVPYGNLNQTTIDVLLNSYQNPQIIGQQPLTNISICNISHCIYKQPNTSITPALTPISFTSNDVQVRVPATMNISTNYILVVNFTKQITGKNFVKIIADGALYSTLQGCVAYFFNQSSQKIEKVANLTASVSVLSTSSGTSKIITISSQLVAKTISMISLQITFKSPQYQLSLQNTEVTLQFQAPSTIYKNLYNVSIIGTLLNSNLSCTSNKTNQVANYTLLIEPILRVGLLTIQIPSYISGLFVGTSLSSPSDDTMSDHLSITVNGNAVDVSGTNSQPIAVNQVSGLYLLSFNSSTQTFSINLMLDPTSNSTDKTISVKLKNVQNPPDNRIIVFRLMQHQIQVTPTSVYGYRELRNKMSVLDPIHVFSGIRNMTKIGARIQLTLDVQTLIGSPDSMIIRLSQTQVLVNQTNTNLCKICIDNSSCEAQNIFIQAVTGSNAIKISPHRPGRHNYTISGCLINSMFSQQPVQGDEIYVGLSLPYQTAQTTNLTSTYITPLISTGQIQILNLSSSSNKRADYTTLSLSIKPENWMNCDGINLKFDELAYYVHKNIECIINGVSVPFYVINSSSLFIQVTVKNSTLNIQVRNIINYIVNSGFVLSALKKKVSNSTNTTQVLRSVGAQISSYNSSDYGISDQISVAPINSGFVSYIASTRIVFPDNYASSQPKKIIAINDYNIPQQLPINTLKYSFTSSYPGCTSQLQYNKTISMYCTMSSPGTASFNVLLFDTKLAATPLTSFTKSIYIYPQPKDHCSNVMCDVCSTGTDGNEYCFACREGLYSSNGQCVSQCPGQTFPYDSRTCTQCSPQCASCFDLYDNSCLSCQNSSLLLDSGTCRKFCTDGYAYQAQYCVDNQQCSSASGCRICSPSGFCYKCLPDFIGQPNCKFADILPKNFFIFWMIPFLLLIPVVGIITCIKVGTATLSHMIIFLLAVVELMSWIFIIPKMPQQSLAMIMCAFLLVKIIISIIAYETYYNKQILKGKQQKLLNANDRESEQKTDHLQANSKKSKQGVKQQSIEQKITHKERLARFSAHFLTCDAYQLLMNRLGKPFMSIAHFTPFLIVYMINRAIVMIFCVFLIVKYASGDLLYVPLISILSGLGIVIIRLINSEKFSACISKIRG